LEALYLKPLAGVGAEADGAQRRDDGRHVAVRPSLEDPLARVQPDGSPPPPWTLKNKISRGMT
jgi:hypothetical protein